MDRKIKLAIATPFYEVKAYSPYIVSLLSSIRVLEELHIEWDYWELSGDSYVDRAKNTLIHRFMEESDFTHIMMIDSDLMWDTAGFIRVLKAAITGAEVVGGAYPNKNNWSTYGALPLMVDGQPIVREAEGLTLYEMWGIPGGFLIYSRKAFERTKPNLNTYIDASLSTSFYEYFKMWVKEANFTDTSNTWEKNIQLEFAKAMIEFGNHIGPNKLEVFLECFRCNIEKNGGRIGEDIYFQQRYREMGGTVWCEPNIHFKHIGVNAWEGNFKLYMENNQEDLKKQSVEILRKQLEDLGQVEEIQHMADEMAVSAAEAGVITPMDA